ncbi:ABC transporter permease [Micromonospora sp. RB23]
MTKDTADGSHKPGEIRTVLTVAVVGILLAMAFVASYTLALDRPPPHRIPTALVGDETSVAQELKASMRGALEYRSYPNAEEARDAIERQRVYAALVVEPGGSRLLVASAAGNSLAQMLRNAALKLDEQGERKVIVTDVRPLPDTDRSGLAAFYVMIAATLLGFLTALQLRNNVGRLPLRTWLAIFAGLAVVGGLALAVIVGPILHGLPAPLPALWGTLAAQIAVTGLFGTLMLILIGRWAVVPTWLIFIAIGNAASGGAVATALLPQPYRAISDIHPNGCVVALLQTTSYFPEAVGVRPVVVEAAWLVGLLGLVLLSARLVRNGPRWK